MNICLFGAASNRTKENYIRKVEELGKILAKRGHNMVYGAGGAGLMGAAARGFKAGGGKVTGVLPAFFLHEVEATLFPDCDEMIYTETMAERKAIMEEKADAFLTVPGGIGTLEEFLEVLTLRQLDRHDKALVLFNVNGYFDELKAMLDRAVEEGFLKARCLDYLLITEDAEEAASYLEAGDPEHSGSDGGIGRI